MWRMDARTKISIHVPREGDDSIRLVMMTVPLVFQSTSPARGTTVVVEVSNKVEVISIHVPREGDDLNFCLLANNFL